MALADRLACCSVNQLAELHMDAFAIDGGVWEDGGKGIDVRPLGLGHLLRGSFWLLWCAHLHFVFTSIGLFAGDKVAVDRDSHR
jgi:hypothetical protein